MKTEKDALDKLIVKNPYYFYFGKWKFVSYGKDYRKAVRKIAPQIQFQFKKMPKKLPMLVKVIQGKERHYWDIREFFKEAGIKLQEKGGF